MAERAPPMIEGTAAALLTWPFGIGIQNVPFSRSEARAFLAGRVGAGELHEDANVPVKIGLGPVKDSDLLPAIRAVQATFPSKQIGVIVPIGRASEDLKNRMR
jgi:hypothetical protein